MHKELTPDNNYNVNGNYLAPETTYRVQGGPKVTTHTQPFNI